MASDTYTGLSSVQPTGPQGDAYQHINVTVRPPNTAPVWEGVHELAQGGLRAASYFGEVAADDAATQYQKRVETIMHGDPQAKGPDGKPDLGFMGLKGRAALDARPDTDRRMEDLRKEIQGGLVTLQQRRRFNDFSRRYKTFAEGRMGQHADTQANVWYDQVDKAASDNWQQHIANNATDPDQVIQGREELRRIYVQKAERAGGGPEMVTAAVNRADREAVAVQASAIAVTDPAKAMRIIEHNKNALGTYYDDLANRFRARGEQQNGRELADGMLSGAPPPKGDDAASVLRHFEGFREKPYWDVNHWRVGYGSDTITKADGSVHPVTENTTVSKEDAERDLERRVGASQGALRQKIGNEAWGKLSPQSKASLTSVAYNYGDGGIPDAVVTAARSGNPAAISAAVRGLAGHNNGINASRRASEANNIAPGESPPRTQAYLITEIQARNLPPQAEAAAVARVNQAYRLHDAVETKRRADFKQKVDDGTAEALNTGVTSTPLPESDFVQHYGPADGAARYADYASNLTYAADRHAVETMSDVQQQQFLNSRTPQPGARGYAHAMQRQVHLEKDVGKIQEARRNDPAEAVAKNAAVVTALGGYNEKDPSSFKAVAEARLAAQERLGIDPEYRSPITKTEALKLTTPLRRVIAGDTQGSLQALREIGTKFQAMFGDQADEAFAYALRAQKVEAEVAQQAGTVLRKLRTGEPLAPSDVRGTDQAAEAAASRNAVRGLAPRPEPALPRIIGNPDQPDPSDPGGTVKRATVPPAAIEFLLKNPASQKAFDEKYGAGRSKEIMERYPVAPGLP